MSGSGVQSRLSAVRDGLRTQLWPIPLIGIVLGLACGIGLPRLDARVDDDLPAAVTEYLFGGGASAARTLLGAVAGSLITVTSLTFSLTVLTLQLASSQFSPRLLRTFTRDRFVHVTLALFLGTFSYALAVLRTVRDAGDRQALFVPQISVTVAFVLGVSSVVGLVLFLAHLAREIRVETMLRKVRAEANGTVRRILQAHQPGRIPANGPSAPSDAAALPSHASGFLVGADEDALLAAALDAKATVRVYCCPGDFVVAGTPLGVGWPDAGSFDADALTRLRDRVAAAIATAFERTAANDIGYGLRQLTDVTNKALSPGINDPTTAVHALGHSCALLCELSGHDLGPRLLRDERGQVRVVLAQRGFADLLELAIAQPRRYGAGDPSVLGRLFELLRELAWCTEQSDHRRAVAEQLTRLRATAAAEDFDDAENTRLAELATQVEHAQAGRWTPASSTL